MRNRQKQRYIVYVLMFFALLSVQGCISSTSHTTATPIGKGNYELTAAPSASYPGIAAFWIFPDMEVLYFTGFALRYGATENLDVGLRLNGFGQLVVDTKFALLNNKHMALSLMPSLGFVWDEGLLATLHVLLDIKFSAYHKLTFGAKTGGIAGIGGIHGFHPPIFHGGVGGELAFEFRVAPRFYLQPYVSMAFLGSSQANTNGPSSLSVPPLRVNAGIAIKYRIE
ncbi:MAG TPA: hypothetical protein DCE42_03235 [Myxococcales bacterium]|nr:hypothetical protein [Deltaproteobacteria bacterium]HAA53738.1 hypothetical protein [Myxococcales bacterium]